MVSLSLCCSCCPHPHNLMSRWQTCPSFIALRQQFTLFPCFHIPVPLMLLDPFLNLPAQKLAIFSKKSKHCWEATSTPPSNFSSVFQPLLLILKESLLLRKPLSTEPNPCITIDYWIIQTTGSDLASPAQNPVTSRWWRKRSSKALKHMAIFRNVN